LFFPQGKRYLGLYHAASTFLIIHPWFSDFWWWWSWGANHLSHQ